MKLNDERIIKGKLVNEIYQKKIDEIGIDKFLKELKKAYEKNSVDSIKNSYEYFKKDLKMAPIALKDKTLIPYLDIMKKNKNDLTIFEIEDDEIEYKIKFPLIPFNKFYIATNIFERIDNDFITIGGFFVLELDEETLLIIYNWSKVIKDGWSFNAFLSDNNGLLKPTSELKIDAGEVNNEFHRKVQLIGMEKFHHLMKKLIYKINKREYTTYKKYSFGNYETKNIGFASNVCSHARHFWIDTGYFKIPSMPKEELISRGYCIQELVLKDGRLRKNVPFMKIGESKRDGIKKKENKVYDLIGKRIWKQEQKLYNILKELFPDNYYIRRHDRRTLNGLELDFNLPELRLGIEYDGEQHFDRKLCEEVFKSDFDALKKRDKEKEKRCRKKNITLIRIKYDEPLTKTNVKKKLKEFLS